MTKLLMNDEDLKIILHVSSDEILDMVAKGMPHYYYGDHFYFNYDEVQKWLTETVELGYIENQYQEITDYLRSILKEEIDLDQLREQIRQYMLKFKGLSDERLVWLYNNCGGDKYAVFCEYIHRYFPGIKSKNIYKYYFALLKTLLDTGVYKDSINHHVLG